MIVKIEKNIPIPQHRSDNGKSKYPLDKLLIGDSILIPKGSRAGVVAHAQMKTGFRFTTRPVSKTHCRVWRIS